MAARFGANYEHHPMVVPIWKHLEGIEQKLSRLDVAVSAILERLELSSSGAPSNSTRPASTTLKDEIPAAVQKSNEPYTYRALDAARSEIRLLALDLAGDVDGMLSGKLVHVSLEEQARSELNQYNALSYVWGEPTMQKCISVEGHPLLVTENLESALRHMRKLVIRNRPQSTDESRWSYWWIDQICEFFLLDEAA